MRGNQLPLFDTEIINTMQAVQAQEHILARKYGLNGLAALGSDEYKELQRLIGIATSRCHEYGVNYMAMYEIAKGV